MGETVSYLKGSLVEARDTIAVQAARIAALEAEVAGLKEGHEAASLEAFGLHMAVLGRAERAEAALATARADALEEAARVADAWLHVPTMKLRAGEMTAQEARTAKAVVTAIANAIRALALTQPASTQPLTDQGETSTTGGALK